MTKNIVLAVVIWLVTFACSVLAIVLASLARGRNLSWSAFLAVAAAVVSIMGLTAWTPFGFFPEFGYTWSNGPFEVSVRSGWFFLVPLLVGVLALFVAGWKHRRRNDSA